MPGSIVKRGKRFSVKVYVGGNPPTSKWYSGFDTRREAETFREQLSSHPLHAAGAGIYGSSRLRLRAYLDDWLAEQQSRVKLGALKARTFERYEELARVHVVSRIGFVPLVKVGPQHLKTLYRAMLDAGRSPSTIRRVGMLLHKCFADAIREGLITQNPVAFTTLPQDAHYEAAIWDEEQVRLFVGEARRSSRFPAFWLLMVSTGLRLGEGMAVRVRDVDTNLGLLHVRQTLSRQRGGLVLSTPKSIASRRTLSLPPEVCEALRGLKSHRAAHGPDALLFVQEHGAPLRPRQIRADFNSVSKRAGLPRIRVHGLRHFVGSFVTHRIGVKAAQERLGHSTAVFTMKSYVHSTPGQQAETAHLMSGLLATGLLPSQEVSSDSDGNRHE